VRAHSWLIERVDPDTVRGLAAELGVSLELAAVLARRGFADVASARRFLAADERHDPELLPGARAAAELIARHVGSGERIVVHGDYDVDGVAATAVAVRALRALGCEPAWHLPARDEGYGLSLATVAQLASRGCRLLVAVDCGITATAEIARARELGIEVVVVDHHRPGAALPDAVIVHPALGSERYPTESLCATAVTAKLFALVARVCGADEDEVLAQARELAALATVCDVVPLVGENRAIVRDGLRAFAATRSVGLRALCEAAGTEPAAVGERELAFLLGPRLNAAGRVERADAALDLLLCDDAERAREIAAELDALNRRRQEEEARTLFAAEAQCARQAAEAALVVAGEGWHPGVVGIVASRLVERWRRPALVLAIEGERARGSGRSLPVFDLHAALVACADHLSRYGGHRLAAGLELPTAALCDFTHAFQRFAASTLSPEDLRLRPRVDAVVTLSRLTLGLADEFERLRPFGEGNPPPLLLVRGVRAERVAALGRNGTHTRLTLADTSGRADAVAFGVRPGELQPLGREGCELALRLERNARGGFLEARARVVAFRSSASAGPAIVRARGRSVIRTAARSARAATSAAGKVVDLRGTDPVMGLNWLVDGSAPALVAVADSARRRDGLARLGLGTDTAVAEWDDLLADPALADDYERIVALDPPPLPEALVAPDALAPLACGRRAYALWGERELRFALSVWRWRLDLRPHLRELWQALAAAGGTLAGDELARALHGRYRHGRPPSLVHALLATLGELGLVAIEGAAPIPHRLVLLATARDRVELERSPTFVRCRRQLDALERAAARATGAGGRELAASSRL